MRNAAITQNPRTQVGRTNARRASTLVVAAGVLAALAGSTLVGCASRGVYTSEAIKSAQSRNSVVKSGVTWQQAQQQFLSGNLERALGTIETTIALNPDVAKSYVLKGRILLEMGLLEPARAALLKGSELDAMNVEALYYRGIVHERFSQYDEALACYQNAMKIDTANPQYVVAAGEMLVTLKRYDEAREMLSAHREGFTHNAGIRQLLGQLAGLRGEHEEAAALLLEARLLAPDDASVLEELCRAQMAAKQFRDAEFNLMALQRLDGYKDRSDLKALHARALSANGRHAEARAALVALTATTEGETNSELWVELGEVCVKLNDWGRLARVSARIMALDPENPDGYLLRAMAHRENAELAQALSVLERGVAKVGPRPRLLTFAALVLSQMGRASEAAAVAQQAAELSDSPRARQFAETLQLKAQTATVPTP
jgi:tetratricopeptide (TPR) repeat protein